MDVKTLRQTFFAHRHEPKSERCQKCGRKWPCQEWRSADQALKRIGE